MQGLADGYFVLPYTIGNYLSDFWATPRSAPTSRCSPTRSGAVADEVDRWLSTGGTRSVDHYHRELGKLVWDYIGMARNQTGLEKAFRRSPRCGRSTTATCGCWARPTP